MGCAPQGPRSKAGCGVRPGPNSPVRPQGSLEGAWFRAGSRATTIRTHGRARTGGRTARTTYVQTQKSKHRSGLYVESNMKVLYVSHTSLVSGAEGALLDLLEALPEDVAPVVACPPGPLADVLIARSVTVKRLPEFSASFRLDARGTSHAAVELLIAGQSLRKIVRATRPDLVHANSLRAGLVAGAALLPQSVPVIVHCHDVVPSSTAAALVTAALKRTSTTILTISQSVARSLADQGLGGRTQVVYNPLDTERFDPMIRSQAQARVELGFEPHQQLLGVIAQITPWKGHELAIRVTATLRERFPIIKLLIVGEAKFINNATRFDNVAYFDSLKRLVDELGLADSVEFCGERPDADVVIRALDVALTPSWNEPFGRSVIEAMALGTPVVVTNVGGPPEYVTDGVDGILLPPNDVPAWTDAIKDLLDDPGRRADMGHRASVTVRTRFDRDRYAKTIVGVYATVLEESVVPRTGNDRSRELARRGRFESKRLRILFVEHSSIVGGAEHSLLELMKAIRDEHEVFLACPEGPLAEVVRSQGFPVLPIPDSQLTFKLSVWGTPLALASAIRARRALHRTIRRVSPDVVHANTLRAGLLAWSRHRTPAVVTHCRDLLPPSRASALVSRAILSGSSQVIAVSEASAARLAGPDWKVRNVSVVDNPVDISRFDPTKCTSEEARRAIGVTGSPILALIAQITPWKGHLRAVRILEHIRNRHPAAELVIVGEAKFVTRSTSYDNRAYERELRHMVADLGLDDAVHFLGERDDIFRVLAGTDVLLVPSTEEPFGRTVIEAMAMGVPVIATDAGGPAEIIREGVDGLVLPPDATGRWAEAASSLAQRARSSDSRDYAVERFNPRRHGDAVVATYRQIWARRR